MRKVRVLVADSRDLTREGVIQSLAKMDNIEVISSCAFGDEAVKLAAELKPDMVILGGNIIGLDCVEVTQRIKELHPEIRVLIITTLSRQYSDPLFVLNAEADGYVDEDIGLIHLVGHINRVCEGGKALSPLLAERLAESLNIWNKKTKSESKCGLSKRESEVLVLVSEGQTNKQIAQTLFITESTVKAHVHNIFEKMRVQSRGQAAVAARNDQSR